jgi:hypothetical protein
MIVNLDEGRCWRRVICWRRFIFWRRLAAGLLLVATTAALPAREARSAEPLTWERLSQMGGGIDFPHVRGGPEIHATLERTRSYLMSDGTQQTLFFFVSTNCRRGEERANAASINCGGVLGPKVYVPVLFVTPTARPRGSNSLPRDLVMKAGNTNSLEHYVVEDPANARSSGRTKTFWVKLDTPLGGMKTELDAPVVQAALVLCVPVSSSECQKDNVRLANLADASDQAAALPSEQSSPPPALDGRPDPATGPANPANPPPANPPGAVIATVPPPANPRGPANPQVEPPPPQPRPDNARPPGRWLLGLYGPQNIGVGVDASTRAIADAQDQILTSMTTFLNEFHAESFHSPIADLVLMTTSDAAAATFPLKNVLIGTSRQPSPIGSADKFQLDLEGDRRLEAFVSGPTSSGVEASFTSVGDMIKHYAQRLGGTAGPRPPIVVYVGAARPLPETCAEWKKMTADIAVSVQGRPRVLGVVFASISAGQIDQQLGRTERGDPEPIAARTRAPTCNGDGGSILLFVPFPDLISHTPESVLTQAFAAVRRRAKQLEN